MPGPPFRVFSPLRHSFLPKPPFQVCDLSCFLFIEYFLTASVYTGHAGLSLSVVTWVIAHGPSWLGVCLPLVSGWKDIYFCKRSPLWGRTFLLKACFIVLDIIVHDIKRSCILSSIKLWFQQNSYWRDFNLRGRHNLHVVYLREGGGAFPYWNVYWSMIPM